ncbi:type II toxin-antitoxin system PemK/MazF family toxin [Erysipelothrix sp. HDW6C]|uniref:type II toxin-antitoxin system PemK/MazF family toxin n=1 Tax=Erysipelothrix sp. HDW6C TaxID=2714930 RepID=UPI00140E6F09|nr:type II toxin-antitoxin system PemK/MazF family toxin [Erysipelothrix sp. HDW6C]QIK70829.1 type II toxin-antitoxin system PemK/MazF family toxin [Erysipelothrix sp. HDW6C]
MNDLEVRLNQLDHAQKIFKIFIQNSASPKVNALPKWLDKKSNFLMNDIHIFNNRTEKQYKRGTLVFVDFGSNPGSEFCGPHYAIVMNKTDSDKSRTITVMPITSKKDDYKKGKHRIPIGYSVIMNILKKFEVDLDIKIEKALKFQRATINIKKRIELSKRSSDAPKLLAEMKRELVIEGLANRSMRKSTDIVKLWELVSKAEKVSNSEVLKIRNVLDKYTDVGKDSLLLPLNITTVDKVRIYNPINEFDPICRVRVEDDVLDLMDEAILNNYLK